MKRKNTVLEVTPADQIIDDEIQALINDAEVLDRAAEESEITTDPQITGAIIINRLPHHDDDGNKYQPGTRLVVSVEDAELLVNSGDYKFVKFTHEGQNQ